LPFPRKGEAVSGSGEGLQFLAACRSSFGRGRKPIYQEEGRGKFSQKIIKRKINRSHDFQLEKGEKVEVNLPEGASHISTAFSENHSS